MESAAAHQENQFVYSRTGAVRRGVDLAAAATARRLVFIAGLELIFFRRTLSVQIYSRKASDRSGQLFESCSSHFQAAVALSCSG